MDEQLKKILGCIEELEKQIHILNDMPDKNPHSQSLIKQATDTLLPSMRSLFYKMQNIDAKSAANVELERQGLVDLARYEAFAMFYEERPKP